MYSNKKQYGNYDNYSNYGDNKYKNNNAYNDKQKGTYSNSTQKTHFINIPIEDENFVESYSKLAEEMKTVTLNDFYPEMLQKPKKLHMTVCVLSIDSKNQEKIKEIDDLLQKIQPEIQKITQNSLKFEFDGFEALKSVNKTRVLYAKMKENESYEKLMLVVDLIIRNLVNENILDKQKLQFDHIHYDQANDKYSIQLHTTMFNLTFLDRALKKKGKSGPFNINATEILEYLKSKPLPNANISTVHFSEMRENKETGKYNMLYKYDF